MRFRVLVGLVLALSMVLPLVSSAQSISLPNTSVYLVHDIVYSPNSTQFTHTFSADNTTTAGYDTGFSDAYGWRVYANPYVSANVTYANKATLISEVNISLPYSQVTIDSITLSARTNGTGNLRQLWVKVLNSTGGVIYENTNLTLSTTWSTITLTINKQASTQVTIWINATVQSSTTSGEEIDVKDVQLKITYTSNPTVTVPLVPNVEYFNTSFSHSVQLGSTAYLNSSIITLKIIQFLTYNTTNYTTKPTQSGTETIGSYNYTVYTINPANSANTMTVYVLLKNQLTSFNTYIYGTPTNTVLMGEPLNITLPEKANITIPSITKYFVNTTSVIVRFPTTGLHDIYANITEPKIWRIGYAKKTVNITDTAVNFNRPVDIMSQNCTYSLCTIKIPYVVRADRVLVFKDHVWFEGLYIPGYTPEPYNIGFGVWNGNASVDLVTRNLVRVYVYAPSGTKSTLILYGVIPYAIRLNGFLVDPTSAPSLQALLNESTGWYYNGQALYLRATHQSPVVWEIIPLSPLVLSYTETHTPIMILPASLVQATTTTPVQTITMTQEELTNMYTIILIAVVVALIAGIIYYKRR